MLKIICYKCAKVFEVPSYGYTDLTPSKQTAIRQRTVIANCTHCGTANTYNETIQPTTSPYRNGRWAFLSQLFH